MFLLFFVLVGGSVRAQPFAGRAPWSPGPPDACSTVAVPCAQLDDFNLRLRVSGTGFWPGGGEGAAGGSGVLAAALSFYKTAELGIALPIAAVRGPGPTWIYGPPQVRLRWRMGPRMGVGPFGGAWPRDEPYPKKLPAAYDVRPARGTFALGFRFQPLWPGFGGAGPPACRASESSCLAEVGLQATWDVRAWRLLLSGHVEPVAAGDRSHLLVGGRAAVDLFGIGSAFTEALLSQGLVDAKARAGLVLVGGGLRGFRGAHLSAFYGRSFGGLSGDQVAGVQLDVPIDLLWGLLARLTAYVDPFVAADGWVWDDGCRPLFQLGPVKDGHVWNPAQARWVPVGTHLWQRGGQLYEDPEGKTPFAPVVPGTGAPAAVFSGAPWPSGRLARLLPSEGRAWLRRFAEAPDPSRRELCADLMAQAAAELERLARDAKTLAEACQLALRSGRVVEAAAALEPAALRWGAMLGADLARSLACGGGVGTSTVPLSGLAGILKGGGTAAGAGVARHLPVNRRGEPYPTVPCLKTGGEMPFPMGPLRVVPAQERVRWTTHDRGRFISEWHHRGLKRPPALSPMTKDPWDDYEVHHIRPRQFGGSNDFDNLTPLPKSVHGVVTEWWKAYDPS